MRQAKIFVLEEYAGILTELEQNHFRFVYDPTYQGPPVSLTMPVKQCVFDFNSFPPFFDGLLPEGVQLEALLRITKIDRNDLFAQLLQVGGDVVGGVTIVEIAP